MDTDQIIQTIAVYALPVLLAITLHEAAHGYVARAFGDNTAWIAGRITLNPFRHIDPLGTVVMPIAIYFATQGAFLFGYAKPVPVNFNALRRPKRDMIWVALAGPGANLFQALVWGACFVSLKGIGIEEPFLIKTCQAGIFVNVIMMVFNLLPLPPMDGGRVLVGLLPWRAAIAVSRIEPYGFFILLALLLLGIVSEYWMQPLMAVSFTVLDALLTPVRMLFL